MTAMSELLRNTTWGALRGAGTWLADRLAGTAPPRPPGSAVAHPGPPPSPWSGQARLCPGRAVARLPEVRPHMPPAQGHEGPRGEWSPPPPGAGSASPCPCPCLRPGAGDMASRVHPPWKGQASGLHCPPHSGQTRPPWGCDAQAGAPLAPQKPWAGLSQTFSPRGDTPGQSALIWKPGSHPLPRRHEAEWRAPGQDCPPGNSAPHGLRTPRTQGRTSQKGSGFSQETGWPTQRSQSPQVPPEDSGGLERSVQTRPQAVVFGCGSGQGAQRRDPSPQVPELLAARLRKPVLATFQKRGTQLCWMLRGCFAPPAQGVSGWGPRTYGIHVPPAPVECRPHPDPLHPRLGAGQAPGAHTSPPGRPPPPRPPRV